MDVAAAVGLPAPLYVLPNGDGWAYGGFTLDDTSRAYLSRALPDLPDPLTRGAAWVTLWDSLLAGAIAPADFVALGMTALPRETDEQLTQPDPGIPRQCLVALPHRPATAGPGGAARSAVAGRASTDAATPSQKASWLGALRNVSVTPPTVAWLRRVWEKAEEVPGLPLAETDYINLALDLAVREVEGWQDILTAQRGRIENPDRLARFVFVMPALSADPAERERWFRALADVENRRREPWVLEGLELSAPPASRRGIGGVRARRAWRCCGRSRQTGDIFFPVRWMNATLSGHSSTEVAAVVRQFLAELPRDYPPRLRNVILETADELFRVAPAAP